MDFLEIGLAILGQVATAAAVYGGIRSDIRNLRERVQENGSAVAEAHRRIDSIFDRRKAE